jgi:hypothetical protein
MIVEHFNIAHLDEIDLHERQAAARALWTPDYCSKLTGYTVRIGGEIILCGGLLDLYGDRSVGHAWSLLSKKARPHFVRLHGAVERFFETSGKRVIVATTEGGDVCRWLRLLRFRFDHIEPAYGPDGADHAVYVRVQ